MNALHIPLSIQQSIINENIVNIQLIVDRRVLDATSCWGANCTTLINNSKINITRIIGTALGHTNLKCPQIAMKLNIKFWYGNGSINRLIKFCILFNSRRLKKDSSRPRKPKNLWRHCRLFPPPAKFYVVKELFFSWIAEATLDWPWTYYLICCEILRVHVHGVVAFHV
jgi:hypothetical protein